MSKTIWVEVHTSKRSYTVIGGQLVVWYPGEKVISMDVVKVEG